MPDLIIIVFGSLSVLATGAFGYLLKTVENKESVIKAKDIQIDNLNRRVDDLTDLVFGAVMILKSNASKSVVEKADQILDKLSKLKS